MIHFTTPTLRRIKMEVSQLNQQSLGSKVRKGRENRSPPQLMIVVASKKPGIYIYIYKTPRCHRYQNGIFELATSKTRQSRKFLRLDLLGMESWRCFLGLESKVPWEFSKPLHFLGVISYKIYKLKTGITPIISRLFEKPFMDFLWGSWGPKVFDSRYFKRCSVYPV